jgi:hypothetical protein
MDINDNFERAKKLTEDWPAWKRNYQLTKSSEDQKREDRTSGQSSISETSGIPLQASCTS